MLLRLKLKLDAYVESCFCCFIIHCFYPLSVKLMIGADFEIAILFVSMLMFVSKQIWNHMNAIIACRVRDISTC